VPGVLVGERVDLGARHPAPRRVHQRRVQPPLGVAGLLDRVDLRAQVVGAQEVVGDPQPAGRVAL
jgi:hypothetical protein